MHSWSSIQKIRSQWGRLYEKYVYYQVQKHWFFHLCYLIVTPPTCFGTGFGLVLIRASITPAVKFCITFHHIYFDFWFPLILVVIMLARLFFWMCAVGMLIANPDKRKPVSCLLLCVSNFYFRFLKRNRWCISHKSLLCCLHDF